MKNKRLLSSLSFIDDKYVKEAEPKMTVSTISPFKTFVKVACLLLVVAIGLYLFVPITNKAPSLTAYESSEYFPIIEKISDYRYKPSPYKNNFQHLTAEVGDILDIFGGFAKGDANWAPESDGAVNGSLSSSQSNGKYEETTDNQVSGVVEADLMKRTDKYIFRLTLSTLDVYTIDGDNTARVTRFTLPGYEDEGSSRNYQREMYLSKDGNTVTIVSPYYSKNYESRIRITSIDVSDLENINVKKAISIDGSLNTTRMVDGKLLVISEFHAYNGDIDYAKPETFVPTITEGDVSECIKFEDIIYPEEIGSTRYSVVALLEESTLELVRAQALLDYYNDVYVSENNVYVTKEYTVKEETENENEYVSMDMSDIAVLSYAGETLEYLGSLTVEGFVKDQYSMDEFEGHLRVVTTTRSQTYTERQGNGLRVNTAEIAVSSSTRGTNASLYAFNLSTMEKVGEVVSFAPAGEEAASVRFDGDTAYVCTAVVVTFTDPVYFFDLSDYTNITYTDTGTIDGFSSSLIQLGDGFLLGIGEENGRYGKIEVYEERDGAVVSVDKYLINGSYSRDYKSYYIDRENDMFGLAIQYIYDEETGRSYNAYVLLKFNGYELVEVEVIRMNFHSADRVRAFIKDGYLYVTDDKQIVVECVFAEE